MHQEVGGGNNDDGFSWEDAKVKEGETMRCPVCNNDSLKWRTDLDNGVEKHIGCSNCGSIFIWNTSLSLKKVEDG